MSDKKRIDEGYQPKERGYQPAPQKNNHGGMTQDGYTPLKDSAKPTPNPPPKKP